jgi:hypothetical protein
MQAALGPTPGNEISYLRFDNRIAAGLHGFYLRQAEINADYVVALMCEAGSSDSPHIAKPEHANSRLIHAIYLSPVPGTQKMSLWIRPRSIGFPKDPVSEAGRNVVLSQAFSIVYENHDFEKKPILDVQLGIPAIDNIILTLHTV